MLCFSSAVIVSRPPHKIKRKFAIFFTKFTSDFRFDIIIITKGSAEDGKKQAGTDQRADPHLMAQDGFRRVLPLLAVKPVHTPEIRDAAFGLQL